MDNLEELQNAEMAKREESLDIEKQLKEGKELSEAERKTLLNKLADLRREVRKLWHKVQRVTDGVRAVDDISWKTHKLTLNDDTTTSRKISRCDM